MQTYSIPPSVRREIDEEEGDGSVDEVDRASSALPPSYQAGIQQRPIDIAPPDYRDALQDRVLEQPVDTPLSFTDQVRSACA